MTEGDDVFIRDDHRQYPDSLRRKITTVLANGTNRCDRKMLREFLPISTMSTVATSPSSYGDFLPVLYFWLSARSLMEFGPHEFEPFQFHLA